MPSVGDGGMIKFSLTPGKLSNMLSWNADANMQTDALNHKVRKGIAPTHLAGHVLSLAVA